MTAGTRKPGEFCWINMLTPQPADAREFFGTLLGWTYVEIPGMGHGVQVQGHNIGGLFDLASPQTPPGTPPLIGVMVKVDSADATGDRVRSLGGKAQPAFDIMSQGRMADCVDPNGAHFDVWQAKKGPGTDVDSTVHGAPSWFETLTTDAGRASTFYSALFGWTPEASATSGMNYTTFSLNDEPVAGMLEITPEMGKMPPHWATYFTVNDVDATARDAVKLGATICMPLKDISGIGRLCGIVSPQGVMFYAITYMQ